MSGSFTAASMSAWAESQLCSNGTRRSPGSRSFMPKLSRRKTTAKLPPKRMPPDDKRLDPGLARTQRWMQALILTPGECGEAMSAPAVAKQIPVRQGRKMVLPSKTLAPEQRLDIYREMYEARLLEALTVDYPAVLDFLGPQQFDELMHLYVSRHPSRSYTLNRLGDHFPDFVRDEVKGLERAGFVYDLARFELAQTQVFDEEETRPLTPDRIASVPPDKWETARLKPIAALRLVSMKHPAHTYLDSIREEAARPPVRRKQSFLVIFRRDYGVGWLELTPPAYRLLEALVGGATLGDA